MTGASSGVRRRAPERHLGGWGHNGNSSGYRRRGRRATADSGERGRATKILLQWPAAQGQTPKSTRSGHR